MTVVDERADQKLCGAIRPRNLAELETMLRNTSGVLRNGLMLSRQKVGETFISRRITRKGRWMKSLLDVEVKTIPVL